jgi:hypothetical protein
MSTIPNFDSPNDEYDSSQETISQKVLVFEREVRKLLSKRMENDDFVLPFIEHWLVKCRLQHRYRPQDIFLDAYRQLVLEIRDGGDVQNVVAAMKRKSLEIIRLHANQGR